MERLDHLLELGDLLAAVARRAVGVVRGEEPQRVVAPVVDEVALGERGLGEELVHRQQLDRGDAEVAEVVDDGGCREAGVGPAQLLRHAVVQLRHALDVHLVDHRVAPAASRRRVRAPLEVVVDHDAARDVRRRVEVAGLLGLAHGVAEDRVVDDEVAGHRLAVGVEQQLLGVEPQPGVGVPRSVRAVAVAGARRHTGQGAVPHAERVLGQPVAGLDAVVVEDAHPHLLGTGRVDGEVRRLLRPGRPQGVVATRPDLSRLAVVVPDGVPVGGRGHSEPLWTRSRVTAECAHHMHPTLRSHHGVRLDRRHRRGRGPATGPAQDECDQHPGPGRPSRGRRRARRARRRTSRGAVGRGARLRRRQRRQGDGGPHLLRHGEGLLVGQLGHHRHRADPQAGDRRGQRVRPGRGLRARARPPTCASPPRTPSSASPRCSSGSSPAPAAPSG